MSWSNLDNEAYITFPAANIVNFLHASDCSPYTDDPFLLYSESILSTTLN
jgi:hypothetical protein